MTKYNKDYDFTDINPVFLRTIEQKYNHLNLKLMIDYMVMLSKHIE